MKTANQRDILDLMTNEGALLRWDSINAKCHLVSKDGEVLAAVLFNTYIKFTRTGNEYGVAKDHSDYSRDYYGIPAQPVTTETPQLEAKADQSPDSPVATTTTKQTTGRNFGYIDAMHEIMMNTDEDDDVCRRTLCDIVDDYLPDYGYELYTDQDIENALAAMYQETGEGFPDYLYDPALVADLFMEDDDD